MTRFSTVNVMDVQKISIANARANAMLAREETALARKIDYIAAALEEFANAFEASSKPVHAEPAGMPPRLFGSPVAGDDPSAPATRP